MHHSLRHAASRPSFCGRRRRASPSCASAKAGLASKLSVPIFVSFASRVKPREPRNRPNRVNHCCCSYTVGSTAARYKFFKSGLQKSITMLRAPTLSGGAAFLAGAPRELAAPAQHGRSRAATMHRLQARAITLLLQFR